MSSKEAVGQTLLLSVVTLLLVACRSTSVATQATLSKATNQQQQLKIQRIEKDGKTISATATLRSDFVTISEDGSRGDVTVASPRPALTPDTVKIEHEAVVDPQSGMVCFIGKSDTVMVSADELLAMHKERRNITARGDTIFFTTAREADFPGGKFARLEFTAKNMKYPTKSAERGHQGRVVLQFTVEKDGSLTNIHVVRGVDAEIDREAIRLITIMPKWVPATIDGQIVRSQFVLPFIFRLGPSRQVVRFR